MKILCPTCAGKGFIPDPKINGPICYCGPNGERWPEIMCQSCGGSGWILDNKEIQLIMDRYNYVFKKLAEGDEIIQDE